MTFVKEYGLGLYAPRPEQLLESIRELAADGGRLQAKMAASAAAISRPYASLDIARECLNHACRAQAGGSALAG